jgi:preprotein translocase subunit SecG
MVGFLMVIHYIVCFSLILVVLLQSGKGGGLAGAFGGGGSTIFGGRGAGTVLTRATMVLGAMFFVTSLTLALLSTQGGTGASTGKSLIQEEAKRSSGSQPTSGPAQGTNPAGGTQTLPTGGAQTPPAGTTPAPTTPAPAPATTPSKAPAGGTTK